MTHVLDEAFRLVQGLVRGLDVELGTVAVHAHLADKGALAQVLAHAGQNAAGPAMDGAEIGRRGCAVIKRGPHTTIVDQLKKSQGGILRFIYVCKIMTEMKNF